jgi:hypothetical protein
MSASNWGLVGAAWTAGAIAAACAAPAAPPASSASSTAAGEHLEPEPLVQVPPRRGPSLVVTVAPTVTELDGRAGAAACDFNRLYRGSVGTQTLSVHLKKATNAAELIGEAHDDADRPARKLRGKVGGDLAFEWTEEGGSKWVGTCDPATGALTGTFTNKQGAEPLELWPRPAGWPRLFALRRTTRVEANHPACRTKAQPDAMTEIDVGGEDSAPVICLPRDPRKRRQLVSEGIGVCSAEDVGARIWGLPPAVSRAANRTLASAFHDDHVATAKQCWHLAQMSSTTRVLYATDGLLTVGESSIRDEGGAHPLIAISGGTTVDLVTGSMVSLESVVVRPEALRDLAATCIRRFERVREIETSQTIPLETDPPVGCDDPIGAPYLWGCDGEASGGPKWALVEGGIAIFANGSPHVAASLDGTGPIVSWQALLREKLLQPDSPVARLWKGIEPAASSAPACSSGFAGDRLVSWRQIR